MKGIKHTIECHCVLPQFARKPKPIYHKFVVFSIVDDSDSVKPKFVQCNNCGVVHKVFDLCRSEIITGNDELRVVTNIDDIKISISENLSQILESYNAGLPIWEHAQFIVENELWSSEIILQNETISDDIQGKLLIFKGPNSYKIENFLHQGIVKHG